MAYFNSPSPILTLCCFFHPLLTAPLSHFVGYTSL